MTKSDSVLVILTLIGCVGVLGTALVIRYQKRRESKEAPFNVETSPRPWRAFSPSGNVLLGSALTYGQALERASKLGAVTHADMANGFIFYNTALNPASGKPPAEF